MSKRSTKRVRMAVRATRDELVPALAMANAIADQKSALPILAHVRLTAHSDGWLELAATDVCVSIRSRVNVRVRRAGSVTLVARTLFEVVRGFPDGDIELTADDADVVRVRSGDFRYRLPGTRAADFPTLPDASPQAFDDLDPQQLRRLLAMTQHSMSSDESRPHIAGTLLEADARMIRLVTTDGHRLSKAEASMPVAASLSAFIPRKGALELARVLDAQAAAPGALGLAIIGDRVFFRRGLTLLSVAVADAQGYPAYAKVIRTSSDRFLVVDRDALVSALRCTTLVDRGGIVRIDLSAGKMLLRCERPEVGEGTAHLSVDFKGEPTTFAIQARYLLDALSSLPGADIKLEVGGARDPCVVRSPVDESFLGVIMPLRLPWGCG